MRGGMEREEGFRVHFVTEAVEGKEMRENWNTQLVRRRRVSKADSHMNVCVALRERERGGLCTDRRDRLVRRWAGRRC